MEISRSAYTFLWFEIIYNKYIKPLILDTENKFSIHL